MPRRRIPIPFATMIAMFFAIGLLAFYIGYESGPDNTAEILQIGELETLIAEQDMTISSLTNFLGESQLSITALENEVGGLTQSLRAQSMEMGELQGVVQIYNNFMASFDILDSYDSIVVMQPPFSWADDIRREIPNVSFYYRSNAFMFPEFSTDTNDAYVIIVEDFNATTFIRWIFEMENKSTQMQEFITHYDFFVVTQIPKF